jgi:hypothetical protein
VFGITQLNEEELTDWMNFTNDFHPTVKYTREISVNTINFLDITIINDKETLTPNHQLTAITTSNSTHSTQRAVRTPSPTANFYPSEN